MRIDFSQITQHTSFLQLLTSVKSGKTLMSYINTLVFANSCVNLYNYDVIIALHFMYFVYGG